MEVRKLGEIMVDTDKHREWLAAQLHQLLAQLCGIQESVSHVLLVDAIGSIGNNSY